MKSRLLNLAAAVSLLLAVAIVVQWVRSYWRLEVVARTWHTGTEQHAQFVQSSYGWLSFATSRDRNKFQQIAPRYDYYNDPPVNMQREPSFTPVHLYRSSSPEHSQSDLMIAYWLLLPLALILPTIATARHRRGRQRETNNLCPTCGYDLRAHNAGDRCPECGIVPSRAR